MCVKVFKQWYGLQVSEQLTLGIAWEHWGSNNQGLLYCINNNSVFLQCTVTFSKIINITSL